MYTPPFDERYDDDEGGEERVQHAIPPRKSALPSRYSLRQQNDFSTDEHPEIPKIRRASLKQFKDEAAPATDPRIDRAQPGKRVAGSEKLIRDPRQPFRNPLEEEEHFYLEREIPLYPHLARKMARQPLPPLTGLEDAEEVRAWRQETGYHRRISRKRVEETRATLAAFDLEDVEDETGSYRTLARRQRTASRPEPATEGMYLPRIPRRRPGSAVEPVTDHTGSFWHVGFPVLERRQLWILLGLCAMLLVIFMPLMLHGIVSSPTASYTMPGLPAASSNPHEIVIMPPVTDHPTPPLFATSAYLLDQDHETTLYAQNPFLHLPMLSTTKLMSALLTVEQGKLDQQVTITPQMQQQIDALSADSALFGLKEGQTYTLRDLLYGMLYASGNDAALVVADTVGGSEENFVEEMNQEARRLGMLDTHFVNPHGLLDDGQYSCAHDLAILGQASLSNPTIQQISGGKTYQIAANESHPARALLNGNQFLWWYPGVTGGKTGYDGASNFVQVVAVTRNHHRLIGVVMHTANWWTDMRDLVDYGSTDYAWASPRDVDASGHPVIYDNLWHYFSDDTPQYTVSLGTRGRYYVYTGYSISGPIMTYFDQQGGLQKFGFPTTMPVPSGGTLLTQRFQHGAIQCNTAHQQCRNI